MNKIVKNILKYSISFLIATGIFFLVISIRNIYSITDLQQIYRYLSDGFIIPGVLFIAVGLLIFLSNEGALRGVGYVVKRAVLMLLPFLGAKHETYAEYCANYKKANGFSFFFIIGGLFTLAGIIFTILFYTL
ncbi:MAG: DUF3899 domain-containing protein [Bacilli bacterium]|nr:DUF3899 domain-containing protein [Erysipelotrichaceae bacterium]MDY4818638.1 DUF3899 domain-containing protein [Bacilli bacterium]MDY5669073.1 DUF3899 domain-containing protein [Bacilli bacterium]